MTQRLITLRGRTPDTALIGTLAVILAGGPVEAQTPFPEWKTTVAAAQLQGAARAAPSSRTPAKKPLRKPERVSDFAYEIIGVIRAQSEELCARYGSPVDCLEETEICLTMRDHADNAVRLCLTNFPDDSAGEVEKKARMRQ
jgi:hypothetical protein